MNANLEIIRNCLNEFEILAQYDTTVYTYKSEIRDNSGTLIATFTCTSSALTPNETIDGQTYTYLITLSLSKVLSTALTDTGENEYEWDLIEQYGTTTGYPLYEGNVTVKSSKTT